MIKYTLNPKMRPRPSFGAIYEKLGMDFGIVKDIRQIYANPTTTETMRLNVLRWVNRKYRFLSERKKQSMVSMDALGYAPMTNYDIPDNEIWVNETL